jgi:hypothetical protein
MADIFVSFAQHDHRIVESLWYIFHESYPRLTLFNSADSWLILPGDNWFQRIRTELTSAKVVLLLLSERSVISPWLNFEAGAAWLAGKTMIPACIGSLDKGHLPKPYSDLQGANLPADTYNLLNKIGDCFQLVSPTPGYDEHSQALPKLKAAIAETYPTA